MASAAAKSAGRELNERASRVSRVPRVSRVSRVPRVSRASRVPRV